MKQTAIVAAILPLTAAIAPLTAGAAKKEAPKETSTPRQPNIVLFYVDDMGYGDMALTGAIGYHTPNLDRLAHDGMLFTQYYSPSPVSSASRAGMMTGCYPPRVGFMGVLSPRSDTGLSLSELTISEMLKKKGYATSMVGKWHMGDAPEFMPMERGFDEYLGLPYSNDMWPYGKNAVRGQAPKKDVGLKHQPLLLYDGRKAIETISTLKQQDQLTTRYTERAVSFIKRSAGKPFFLYMPHSMPHVPLAVSSKFAGKSEMGPFGDVIMEIDWSVGQIVETIEKAGLSDNTLIVFTSDNGPWLNFGDHAGSAGGLKEGKHTSLEGGQRVPCIMKWPAVIPAGRVCNRLASSIDLLPTLAQITDGKLSSNKIDGVSLLPLMQGDLQAKPRTTFFYYQATNIRAVRDERFKLIAPHTSSSYEGVLPGTDGKPGPMAKQTCDWMLFDLRRDPGERYNVIEMYPGETERLKEEIDRMGHLLGNALMKIKGTEDRPAGKTDYFKQ
ncbi:arylsulfatase [Bacteroidia bacterium]|nr:arylsulfatase [Bacteroidia bacterium]